MRSSASEHFDNLQVINYLKSRVLPILQPLQMDILQNRPNDVRSFSYIWLQSYKYNQSKTNNNKQLQNIQQDDELQDQVFKQRIRKKKFNRNKFRVGVLGQSSIAKTEKIQKFPQFMSFQRTQQSKIKILIQLKNSILFKDLNHNSLLKMISLMRILEYQKGNIVIRQGEQGNQLFIVDQGRFKCSFSQKKYQQKTYGPGEAFGELALLYNTKRASTIIAETNGRLYSLGRAEFNSILQQNVKKKAQMCEKIINNIDIFQTLDRYQKSKVYESMKQIQILSGKYVIKEGQIGDCFYIVAEGKLVAQKIEDEESKPVYYYKQGDYFGQLAIMKNVARQASVKALTKVRLYYIERNAFKRLLGSIQTILRRNQTRYKNFSNKKTKKRKDSIEPEGMA